jgi:hypothetical protein
VQSEVHTPLRTGTLEEPMSIELNHTIVHVKNRWAASREVGEVLGLPAATAYGPFAELRLDNAVSLDFMDSEGEIHGQHYAFLVSEEDFDLILYDGHWLEIITRPYGSGG